MSEPTYSPAKFEEMLVYVVSGFEHEVTNGDTKLNKLLYFADVAAFRRTGRPISGARYEHRERGPVAEPLWPVREELKGKRLDYSEKLFGSAIQRRTKALDEPDIPDLSDEEREILDEVIERFRGCKSNEMEDFAHDEPAWLMTDEGDTMPYRSALLVRSASPAAMKHGEQLRERLGKLPYPRERRC